MSDYATWSDWLLKASIEDRQDQLRSLREAARQMVRSFEMAEVQTRTDAGHAAIYIGSLDAETFVYGAVADAEDDLKEQLRHMREELEEREQAEEESVA